MKRRKKAAQERMSKEKRKEAMERAMEPPKKRVGNPIMYRSRFVSKTTAKGRKEPDADEIDGMKLMNKIRATIIIYL